MTNEHHGFLKSIISYLNITEQRIKYYILKHLLQSRCLFKVTYNLAKFYATNEISTNWKSKHTNLFIMHKKKKKNLNFVPILTAALHDHFISASSSLFIFMNTLQILLLAFYFPFEFPAFLSRFVSSSKSTNYKELPGKNCKWTTYSHPLACRQPKGWEGESKFCPWCKVQRT